MNFLEKAPKGRTHQNEKGETVLTSEVVYTIGKRGYPFYQTNIFILKEFTGPYGETLIGWVPEK